MQKVKSNTKPKYFVPNPIFIVQEILLVSISVFKPKDYLTPGPKSTIRLLRDRLLHPFNLEIYVTKT